VGVVDNGVLSLLFLLGRSTAEGRRSRTGRQRRWNFNDVSYVRWKREREGNVMRPFSEGRGGGDEAAPRYRRRTTQR
jgi:hypothetical protein